MKHKINLVFEQLSFQKFVIAHNIRKCIHETLNAEGVDVRCEINVLVTDDAGIRVINRESRNLDKATDVLSFPMFQLEAGSLPEDWAWFLLAICASAWNELLLRPRNSVIPSVVR